MGSRARSARSGFQNNGMERGKAGKAAADFYHAPAGLLELPRKRDVPPPAPGTGDGSAIRDSPQSVGGVSSFRFLVSSVCEPISCPALSKNETRNSKLETTFLVTRALSGFMRQLAVNVGPELLDHDDDSVEAYLRSPYAGGVGQS